MRYRVVERLTEKYARLVRPAPCDVANRVPSTAQNQQRLVEALYKLDAFPVPLQREVEAPEAVPREAVGAALEDDRTRVVRLHDLGDDRLEDGAVRGVIDAFLEREVDAVVLAVLVPDVLDVAGAREEVAELMEGARHDAVGHIERLLHAVPVVDVDVDVDHALVLLQKLQDRQHAVVHVAKARRLALLGVVEAAGPVDHDVALVRVESHGAANRAAGVDLAKLEEAVEHGAVFAHIEPAAEAARARACCPG